MGNLDAIGCARLFDSQCNREKARSPTESRKMEFRKGSESSGIHFGSVG